MSIATPRLTSPLVAFRRWEIHDGMLRSLTRGERWARAEMRATCQDPPTFHGSKSVKTPHRAPHRGCSCGIYALPYPPGDVWHIDAQEVVDGVVTLTGHVEVHGEGFRAERARIEVLGVSSTASPLMQEMVRYVARALEVPTVPYGALATVAEEFGSRLPAALLPKWDPE